MVGIVSHLCSFTLSKTQLEKWDRKGQLGDTFGEATLLAILQILKFFCLMLFGAWELTSRTSQMPQYLVQLVPTAAWPTRSV